MNNLNLIDIADDLVILNKSTIDRLFSLDNADECITLYIFYYKIAKWQKTNTIKATDEYVRKTLKWGRNKIIRAKQTLKDNGLIEIIQRRSNQKIDGWFIKISYIIAQQEIAKIKVEQEVSNQEVSKATCTEQTINALKENIKCLKKEIEMLKKEKYKKENFDKKLFDKFWDAYPRKVSKGNVEKWFEKNKPNEELVNLMISKISLLKNTEQWKNDKGKYIPYPTTWLNAKGWEDEINIETKTTQTEKRFFN